MYGFLSVGLVRSGRRQSPSVRVVNSTRTADFVGDLVAGADMSGRVRAVEFRNDTTRSDQRQSLVGPVPNSTTRTRPDPTRPDKVRGFVSETRADPTDYVGRPGSPTMSCRARLVELGH